MPDAAAQGLGSLAPVRGKYRSKDLHGKLVVLSYAG
jgi:hypothetical protein